MSAGAKKPAQAPWWTGGAASCMAASITHPIDLLKVRMQTSTTGKPTYTGTVKSIIAQSGPRGLFAGLSASLLRQITYSTTRFAVYDGLKDWLSKSGNLNFGTQLMASIVGGAAGGIVGQPADITNVRMQNDGKLPKELRRNYRNVFDGIFRITREEGISSLFRGLSANVSRAIIMTASQLVSYDVIKAKLLASGYFGDNMVTHFSSSLLAGLIATTCSSPVDVAKTRLMSAVTGMTDALVKIVAKEGPQGLFKGWVSSFSRLGPHTILDGMAFLGKEREGFGVRLP
ncbi:mitochondrial carrier domain-containing protein [Hyaloraphidium curvatum]|nr:mitochondrial carrier domain-containing protein [Hyaloraphidium curvatum]